MKANRKSLNDDCAVVNVVSTLMLMAIVVPIMVIILTSFTGMIMKQIDMMETTSAILEDALIRLEKNRGYDVHTGHGILCNLTNKYAGITFYLIGHEHEVLTTVNISGTEHQCYDYSGYFPIETLPENIIDDDIDGNIHIKFVVRPIATYYDSIVFGDVIKKAYALWNATGNDLPAWKVVSITNNLGDAQTHGNYSVINLEMVEVLNIEQMI